MEEAAVFLSDQCRRQLLVWDLETDRLVPTHGSGYKLEDLRATVLSVLVIDPKLAVSNPSEAIRSADRYEFWHSEAAGAPVELFQSCLDGCLAHVAYNGAAFDMAVRRKHYADLGRWQRHLHSLIDPLVDIRSATGRRWKLDQLLAANGLEGKTDSGAMAPTMWAERDLKRLRNYCFSDCERLAELVLRPRIHLPETVSGVNSVESRAFMVVGGTSEASERSDGSQRSDYYASDGTVSPAADGFPTFPLGSPQSLRQNSPEWYAYRLQKIGSSQAAALMRLSYNTTRDDAFEQLLDPSDAPEETEAMARGRRLEPQVARRYAKHTGYVLKEVGVFPHPEHGTWLFASPDRLVRASDMEPGKFSLLECKSVSKLSSPPPAHWIIQCQLQLACSGAPWVDLAQLETGSETLLIHRVQRDVELVKLAIDRLSDVYRSAKRVFDGKLEADDAFADDFREFTRFDQQDLKAIIADSMRLYVGKPELVPRDRSAI